MKAYVAAPSVACVFGLLLGDAFAAPSPSSQACFADAVDGQRLRNEGRLLQARAKLIACAQPACPSEVARDCTRWLDEVNATIPSFVFGARDGSRNTDLGDAKVLVDGVVVGDTSGGQPISLDPGPHTIRFERAGFAPVSEDVVARGGEKNRRIVARFVATPGSPSTSLSGERPPDAALPTSRPVPMITWVLGGVAIVALGVFAGFGGIGVRDYNTFHCDVGCSAKDKDAVDTKFVVADIALGVSLVALGAAIVTYVTRPVYLP